MSLVVYKQLGLGSFKLTSMRLLMADHTVKKVVSILCDTLVKVDSFIFFSDYIILDYEVNFDVPIILVRPLAMGRALINIEIERIKFRLTHEQVTFNVYQLIK